jgi:hypothetical protein
VVCERVQDGNRLHARPTGLMWCCSAVLPSAVRWHRNGGSDVIPLVNACMTFKVVRLISRPFSTCLPCVHIHVQVIILGNTKMLLQLITMYATKTPYRASHAQRSETTENTTPTPGHALVFDARKSKQDMDSQFNTEMTPHASYIILMHPEPA